MGKMLLRKLMVGLVIVLSTVGTSQAENSFSLSVSCSIPAVPGLNVPLIEEETTRTEPEQNAIIRNEIKEEAKEQMPAMLAQEDTAKTVKTIYSR